MTRCTCSLTRGSKCEYCKRIEPTTITTATAMDYTYIDESSHYSYGDCSSDCDSSDSGDCGCD